MPRRIVVEKVAPRGVQALLALSEHAHSSGLERRLLELVQLRASYQNGCAYCVDMHSKDARAAGESEQRIYGVPVWRETPYYTERERAALAWTEAVTRLGREGVPEALFREVRAHFEEAELAELTLAIAVINAWNRLAIALGSEPGSYTPAPATSRR